MTKKCIFILTNGEWELGDWALYIRSTPETAHFLCGWWVDFADVYFFITTIGELLHFFYVVIHPANGVGSNGFNGLSFDVECI